MVQQLRIKNFKSIKHVDIPCKKVNVFIGEPNGGKSNIIEALALMSPGIFVPAAKDESSRQEISRDVIRYKSIADLFYDSNINRPIEVFTEKMDLWFRYAINTDGVPENRFDVEINNHIQEQAIQSTIKIGHDGKLIDAGQLQSSIFRYYQYQRLNSFEIGYTPHLAPPFGKNLPTLLLSNEEFRDWVSEFFESKGFTLTMKPTENDINMSKVVNKAIYSYPYLSISETLQRIVFYILSIKSNKESVLLFDEPESNTFPFYTTFLAERIALDETNQFFLTTHNPYLLLSLIEKTPVENINVCVVRMKDYETNVIPLNKEQLGEVLDLNMDAFLNLDRIID